MFNYTWHLQYLIFSSERLLKSVYFELKIIWRSINLPIVRYGVSRVIPAEFGTITFYRNLKYSALVLSLTFIFKKKKYDIILRWARNVWYFIGTGTKNCQFWTQNTMTKYCYQYSKRGIRLHTRGIRDHQFIMEASARSGVNVSVKKGLQ